MSSGLGGRAPARLRTSRAGLPALLAALALACASPATAPPDPRASDLGPGVVAVVGGDAIPGETVGRIAAAQRIEPARARDLAIEDALYAEEARARGLDRSPEIAFAARAALARRLLRELVAEAERAGPVTDAELEEASLRHWIDRYRPESSRTVHAVIRYDRAKADAATKQRAAEIADAIRRAVAPAVETARTAPAPESKARLGAPRDPATEWADPAAAAFKAAAEAVPHEGVELLVQSLEPVAADRRVVSATTSTFDPDFAAAASALAKRGDLGNVESMHGVHVILLLERVPAHVVPPEERRRVVHEEVIMIRARAAQAKLLEVKRAEVVVERGADALLAQVPIDRSESSSAAGGAVAP